MATVNRRWGGAWPGHDEARATFPRYHLRTHWSAQAASWSAWHRLQALGEWKAMVVAGVGGRIEWSLRPIAAKRVIGM
ncbi:MAG: hypothetical protein ABR915_24350 [Thermoguttaceae bacterium]